MGPKFAIVFTGVDTDGSTSFMTSLKEQMEQIVLQYNADGESKEISPKIRVVISTYYKGTSMDGAFKKIEEFIDKSDENSISVL